jgi:hypothetical protein
MLAQCGSAHLQSQQQERLRLEHHEFEASLDLGYETTNRYWQFHCEQAIIATRT